MIASVGRACVPRKPDTGHGEGASALHLHYPIAFRYLYYTSATTTDAELQAWIRFSNFERPDRGYRTKGRTPALIFFRTNHQVLHEMGAGDDDQHAA